MARIAQRKDIKPVFARVAFVMMVVCGFLSAISAGEFADMRHPLAADGFADSQPSANPITSLIWRKIIHLASRDAQGFPNGHFSDYDPHVQGMHFDAEFSCPLRYGQCFAAKRDADILSRVVVLHDRECPNTIGRIAVRHAIRALATSVASAIVLPLQTMPPAWTFAHILQESIEGIQPTVARHDASVAIAFMTLIRWVGTSVFHASPCGVFGRAFPDAIVSMLDASLRQFASPAAARLHRIFLPEKMSAENNQLGFAITLTLAKPERSSVLVASDIAQNKQAMESQASQILETRMLSCRMVRSHDMPSHSGCVVGQGHASVPALSRPASFYSSKLKMVA